GSSAVFPRSSHQPAASSTTTTIARLMAVFFKVFMAGLDNPSASLQQRNPGLGRIAMYSFATRPDQPKPQLYRELCAAAEALTDGEPDAVANMANLAALIWQLVPDLNWAGFYRLIGA